jgi:hypothetical protein
MKPSGHHVHLHGSLLHFPSPSHVQCLHGRLEFVANAQKGMDNIHLHFPFYLSKAVHLPKCGPSSIADTREVEVGEYRSLSGSAQVTAFCVTLTATTDGGGEYGMHLTARLQQERSRACAGQLLHMQRSGAVCTSRQIFRWSCSPLIVALFLKNTVV